MAHVIGESKKFLRKCTCRNCNALIEYNVNEVKKWEGRRGRTEGKHWIDCPRCSKEVILKSWDM